MKLIITGSSGFIGSNFLKYFKFKCYELDSINLRNLNWKSDLDTEATAIIHLAGKAHDIKNSSTPEEYFEINTKLTEELFDIFLDSNCRDFIYFSSVKAVTDQTEDIVTEEMVASPKTAYGLSKLQAEEYILSRTLPVGKRVFIFRPSMIHGPGNKGNLNLLYQLVNKGLPWPLGAFQNQRSFCSIENVCYVIQQLLEREDIPSGIYNLADDEAVSTNELIQLIAATIHKKARIFAISKKIISAMARLGDIFRLPLNTERLNKLTENFVVSNSKIKTALQIEKMPVSAKEGLTKTIKSFINDY
jgi:nucleoside-diphosphate-sugar epimerase